MQLKTGQRLIVFLKDEFDLDKNSDHFISTTEHGTKIDTVFLRGLEHLKSEVCMSYFSYHKPIVTCLSLQRDVPIFFTISVNAKI